MLFWLLCLFFFSVQALPRIHVFGDSHASFCFTNTTPLQEIERSTYHYQMFNNDIPLRFIIHWFRNVTMHRVGRDGRFCLNFRKKKVREGSIVVVVFGEIDIRCHLAKQRDLQHKPIEVIVDDVVTRYMHTLQENKNFYENITIVVCGPVPPAERNNENFNPDLPFYGTIEERVVITNLMREKLAEACEQNNFLYLDIYDLYCTTRGDLSYEISDGIVHVNHLYNGPIKQRLIDLLCQAQIIDFSNI